MKSGTFGRSISSAEVVHISAHGIWLLMNEKEYFLSYEDFPWFKNASVSDIFNIEMPHPGHLFWPSLDVDLHLDSINKIEEYPLIYK